MRRRNEFDSPLNACPVCRSDAIAHAKTDYTGIGIWRCRWCRIEFINPQYTDAWLAAFYDQYQRMLAKAHRYGDDLRPRELIHEYNLAHIERFRAPGRFLSVGCGKGVDLTCARRRGWLAVGFDVDKAYVAQRAAELGIPIHSGDFQAIPEPAASFDCVYLNHVLEHPKNPGDYLDRIRDLLAPGGVVYIACPNIGSAANRFKAVLEAARLRRRTAKQYDTWQHLIFYTPRSLGDLLATRYGFEVLFAGNDVKAEIGDRQVRRARPERWCHKSSFRLIARNGPPNRG